MPNFKYSPHCIRTRLAVLEPALMAGNGVGMWSGKTDEGPIDITAGELRERGHAIQVTDGGAGFYAIRETDAPTLQYDIDWTTETVSLSDGTEMPLEAFREGAVRATPEGKILCSFLLPLHEQHRICREAGTGGRLHNQDLAAFATHSRAEGFTPETGMYDIVTSEMPDKLSDMEAMMAAGARAVTETAPIFARLEEMGIPRQAWVKLSSVPQFGIEQVRATYRALMEPYIGDIPIEDVSMIIADEAILTACLDAAADKLTINEPFTGGNIIPDYRTSPVRHYVSEGMEAIVFTDPMGAYAYTWAPGPKPEAEPDQAPRI